MRVLLTCVPAEGHFHPLVPLGRALADVGHDVMFATAADFAAHVAAAGFEMVPAGIGPQEAAREFRRRFPSASELPPHERGLLSLAGMLVTVHAGAMVGDLVRICRAWEPDVVVHEEGELAAPVAATVCGIPYANQSWGPLRPREVTERAAAAAAPLWQGAGLDPDPAAGAHAYLYLDRCPPGLQRPEVASVAVAHRLRPDGYDGAPAEVPVWAHDLGRRPAVYVTLGTVPAFNRAPEVFDAVVEALADEAVDVVVTTGPGSDPDRLGRPPANVRVAPYLPQSLVLPHCDLVVCHGGSGSVLAALSHGVPLVLLPRGAPSQAANAEACVAAGVGRMLVGPAVTAATVRDEALRVLRTPSFRERALALRAEISAMPGPEAAVDLLARLAATRRPLFTAG